jgi:hypothetical protein
MECPDSRFLVQRDYPVLAVSDTIQPNATTALMGGIHVIGTATANATGHHLVAPLRGCRLWARKRSAQRAFGHDVLTDD